MRNAKLFAGTSHLVLAERVAAHLGMELAPVSLRRYTNRETTVDLGCSVRQKDVYILQSGSMSTNDHLMEVLIMVSAAKLASARKITVVVPYFPYSKQSKKKKRRGAISGKLVANMLTVAGADHIITMDLHASQMSGFFTIPVDNLFSEPTIGRWLVDNVLRGDDENSVDKTDLVVVAKNAGGAKRVTALADRLGSAFALIHTDNAPSTRPFSRTPSTVLNRSDDDDDDEFDEGQLMEMVNTPLEELADPADVSVSRNAQAIAQATAGIAEQHKKLTSWHKKRNARITLVGDVRDKLVLLLDDMIDHPSSFLTAAEHLMVNCGARACVEICPYVQKVIVTNTFPIPDELTSASSKLVQIDVAPVLAEAIRRNHNGESISYLFNRNPW
ncbi:phosphoribosyl pyrophosphokinase [Linderina pennispora]|uniref:ribose-phosphate diphosphokinase n=1 Tax=Linderina pennispora TaxID=61395 RepID=A0A1Y1WBG2_9FUNG|nr:phosphoribosyl pyrophosphokinase [Linderina pennispora]ORX70494.1 phosphoribosyl pyrophosphokinase [Linderina pennispora]